MMSKFCPTLVALIILGYLAVLTSGSIIKIHNKTDMFTNLNNILVHTVKTCELGIKNIIIFDEQKGSSTFDSWSILQPFTGMNIKSTYREDKFRRLSETGEYQAIVLIIDRRIDPYQLALSAALKWDCNANCTIFIISRNVRDCSFGRDIMYFIARRLIPYGYYICQMKPRTITTISFNPLIKSRKAPWKQLGQVSLGSSRSLLFFYYTSSTDDNLCEVFTAEKILPKTKPMIVASLFYPNNQVGYITGREAERYKEEFTPLYEILQALERFSKIEFIFQQLPYTEQFDDGWNTDIASNSESDAHFGMAVSNIQPDLGDASARLAWHEVIIVSHNRGLATPLEKIVKFYGIWTLISLIILMTITFVVIWLKTGRSVSSAAFDILRLLINSGVDVSIDTSALRLFFSMIFLYVIVIQATFSGHLAEFLTIPAYRDNIEFLDELKDPRIKTVYAPRWGMLTCKENCKWLQQKFKRTKDTAFCLTDIWYDPDSVCVGYADSYQSLLDEKYNVTRDKLYLSKNVIESMPSSMSYRRRFPLREKFDYAIMYLFETKLIMRRDYMNVNVYMNARIADIHRSHYNFRPIVLDDLKFIFIFLIGGHSLATLCFLIELLIYQRRNIAVKLQKKWNFLKLKLWSRNTYKQQQIRRIVVQPKLT